jgi:uncharacterized protein YbjT (DUF2867 family)
MSAEKKLVVVSGITGNQGCAVAHGLQAYPQFGIRGFAREFTPEHLQKGKDNNIELVKGDLFNTENLRNVLRGAWGAFLVTQFWEREAWTEEKEFQEGKNFIDAAKQEGVKFIVFSALESGSAAPGCTIRIPHFEGKARIIDYLKHSGIQYAIVRLPFYFENFLKNAAPKKVVSAGGGGGEKAPSAAVPAAAAASPTSDRYVVDIPMGDAKMHGMGVCDMGPIVAKMFSDPGQFVGCNVGISAECLTLAEYCAIMTKVLGKQIEYKPVTLENYKSRVEGGPELSEQFKYWSTHNEHHINTYNIALTRQFNPNVKPFEQWCRDHANEFKL